MSLETGTYLHDLNTANPVGASDLLAQGDDHIRLVKTTLKNTFPNMAGTAWRVQNKGTNYTLAATDNMSVIRGTAGITLATEAAATIGNGFIALVVADGGDVVIDPNGAETINGAASLTVINNSAVVVYCNGSLFYALQLMIPNGVGLYLPAGQSITFEGTTADAFETVLSAGDPTADRALTLPDKSGTLATTDDIPATTAPTVVRTEFTASGNLTIPAGVTQVMITGQAAGGGGGGLTGAGSNGGNLTFGKNGEAVSITLTGGTGGATISGASGGAGGAGGGSGLQQGRSGQAGQYSQSVGGGVNPANYAIRRGGVGGPGIFGELGGGGDGADSSTSSGGVTSDGGGGGGGAGEQVFRKLITVTAGQWDVTINAAGGVGTGIGGGTPASAGKGGFLVVEYYT